MNDSGTAERDGIDSYSDSAGHYNVESLSELNGDSVNDDHDFKCDDDDFPGSSNGVAASSIVHRKIADCLTRRSVLLDLSRQGLQSFPEEASDLQHIEYLYLEGNELSALPDEFFMFFPRLKWLDLRRNHLASLPNLCLGSHQCLRTILLEDNKLQMLPLELGLVRTLDGLNLRNNQLTLPPPDIVNKGIKKILSYLRRLLKAKIGGDIPDSHSADAEHSGSELSPDEGDLADLDRPLRSAESGKSSRKVPFERRRPAATAAVPVAAAAAHGVAEFSADASAPPVSSLLCLTVNRNGSSKTKKYLSQSEKYLKPADDIISEARIQTKYKEERKFARLRNTKLKQDEVIQGRKDQEMVKNFREETKRLQAKKLAERRLNGFVDFVEPATMAPFGISGEDMKTVSNAERLELNVTKEQKQDKALRPLSPETLMRMEASRMQREQQLREKIREHALEMQARRRMPYGNPLEDMKAAQRELEVALQLQKEVERQRKELEYRFTASTVNAIESASAKPRRAK